MSRIVYIVIFGLLALLLFNSCHNKLDLNAPYKEIPSVYALLNPYETRQMIRINKAFLGEGDANQMAKVSDSVNYQPDEITVTLKHSSNPKIITFQEMMITTENGAFTNQQRVYYTDSQLEKTGTYTLTIKNNHTGNEFTSVASLIPQVSADQGYGPISKPYYPLPTTAQSGFINYYNIVQTTNQTPVVFQPVAGGVIYKLVIRTNYRNDFADGSYTFDYVDFNFDDPRTTRQYSGVSFIAVTFKSIDYFSNLGFGMSKKPDDGALGRTPMYLEYFVYASTQEYLDWTEFAKPSLSLNQNKPLYSNFKNGAALGIFTFRTSVVVQKQLDPVFINAISYHPSTCQYRFKDFSGNVEGCH